ncbi:cobalt-precorrin-5B (C(1))-methyltransferase [Niveispirillum irakense]|uniref:cobalt-precorrin-5B (C(1))-methyltransferase n=1 Tax=Niveispirillum irakense TaxID=34011 RepID=UPI0003FBEA24|nr:cobalt-precorrin-5B (C(1))-methyltransferase [Niveispirillum irakense]
MMVDPDDPAAGRPLRHGWTTGACATAAAAAAYRALLTGQFPDPVTIRLPGGQMPAFALAMEKLGDGMAEAGVIKDAGDDPDVTHGALVSARISHGPPGSGICFAAGPGVGMVTRPGLPIPPGEPAINPVPRRMMVETLTGIAGTGTPPDLRVEIAVEGGEALAARTLNGRLGIIGGLSILGTTGIVVPYSCAAWIDSIHRGIDVARALGLDHIAASTGSVSEQAVQALYGLPETALIDMGDFIGGVLKYLRRHPVPRLTIAGGVAKMAKLGQGLMDLHSKRGQVDMPRLAQIAASVGCDAAAVAAIASAAGAGEAFVIAGDHAPAMADRLARDARDAAAAKLEGSIVAVEVVMFDRAGRMVAHAPFPGVGR